MIKIYCSISVVLFVWIRLVVISYDVYVQLVMFVLGLKYARSLNNVDFSERSGPGSVVGIESEWGRDFPHLSRSAVGPTQPPAQWVPSLSPGVQSGRGVTLTPHPLLVPWSRKSRAIPLLPLWAVRPVHSLSACTRVHFTFISLLYFMSHWSCL